MMALQQTSDGFSGKQNVMCGTAPGAFLNGSTTETLLTTVGERLNQTYATLPVNTTIPNRTYAQFDVLCWFSFRRKIYPII